MGFPFALPWIPFCFDASTYMSFDRHRRRSAFCQADSTTAGFTTLSASINYTNDKGQHPSDHYPVQAVLRRTQ